MPFPSASRASGAPAILTGRDMVLLSLAFLAAYLPIDWLTFIHPRPSLNITPWNPPAGLYMALLLWTGARGLPMVYATLILADLVVRGHPASISSLLLSNLAIVAGYGAAAHVLRHRVAIGLALNRVRDVGWLVGVTFLSAAVVAPVFVGVFVLDGALPAADLPTLAFQYWLGDAIGIAVVTPFVLLLHRPDQTPAWSVPKTPTAAQTAAIAAALLLVFLPIGDGQFNLFYVLFLPLVWVAVSHGLPGAVLAALAIQSGLIAGLQAIGLPLGAVVYHQTLMLALAITALFLGALVSERREVEARLREHQTELAHLSRLTVTGEMASALAHELNQPLLAAISYARAAQRLLEGDDTPPRAHDLIDKAVIQGTRGRGHPRPAHVPQQGVASTGAGTGQRDPARDADPGARGRGLQPGPASGGHGGAASPRAVRPHPDRAGPPQPRAQQHRGHRRSRQPAARGRPACPGHAARRPDLRGRGQRSRRVGGHGRASLLAVRDHETGGHGARPAHLPLDRRKPRRQALARPHRSDRFRFPGLSARSPFRLPAVP
ncbi:hypothetical protein GAY28_11525 [Azospirillum brasilense]|nr:hypothetical protein [Azospirillum brasilense]